MARPSNLLSDPTLLEAALEGLTLQKRRIDDQMAEIRSILGRRAPGRPGKSASRPQAEASAPAATKKRKRRTLSDTARKRIAAAQKKRWAEYRKKTEGNKG